MSVSDDEVAALRKAIADALGLVESLRARSDVPGDIDLAEQLSHIADRAEQLVVAIGSARLRRLPSLGVVLAVLLVAVGVGGAAIVSGLSDGSALPSATSTTAPLPAGTSVMLAFTHLGGAVLEGVDLRGVTLRGACLRGAVLDGSTLDGVDLEGADLRGASLLQVDIERTSGTFMVDVYTVLDAADAIDEALLARMTTWKPGLPTACAG